MGLINTRNLNKAKALLEKNRHKVGDLVGKATEQVDKASKGKTSAMSAKVEDAARKYSAGGTTHQGQHPDVAPHHESQYIDATSSPVDEAEQRRRESEATIAAANAMKAAAEAAANMMNKAADVAGTESGEPPAGDPANPPSA